MGIIKVNHTNNLYFLSKINMNSKTLIPRIPDNYFTKNGFEDNKTKRVCFAPSIDKALMGLSQNCTGLEFYIHTPEYKIDKKYIYKPSVEQVPDSKITGEIWITTNVKLKCIGKIKVIKDSGKPGHKFKYGDNEGELYDWDWKWIIEYDKDGVAEATLLEKTLSSKERDKLKDSDFGIPELRKYPLTDKNHVLQAMRYFDKCEDKYKKELAKNILKRAEELGMGINKASEYYKIANQETYVNEKVITNKEINKQFIADNKDKIANSMEKDGYDKDTIDFYTTNTKFSAQNKDNFSSKDVRFAEKFDKEKINLIANSKNIIEEYNAYVDLDIDKIIKLKDIDIEKENTGFEVEIKSTFDILKSVGISKDKIIRYIKDTYYEISDDPKIIKKLLQLRVNYNNKIISLLQKMLRKNYQILGIDLEIANAYIAALQDSSYSGMAIGEVKNIIKNNMQKFYKPGLLDLTSLGFGKIFFSKKHQEIMNSEYNSFNRIIQIAMRYDAVVISHGMDIDGKSFENLDNTYKNIRKIKKEIEEYENRLKKFDYIKNKYNLKNSDFLKSPEEKDEIIKNKKFSSEKDKNEFEEGLKRNRDVAENYQYYLEKIKKLEKEKDDLFKDADEYNSKIKNTWGCQPIEIDGKEFTEVNDLCRYLANKKYKKIYICCCNPGHYELDDDLKTRKDVLIRVSMSNTLID